MTTNEIAPAPLDGLIPDEPGQAHLDVLTATEQQVLGAVLTMTATMNDVSLEIAHWRDPMHQALYARMVDRHGRSLPVDALSMAQAITTDRSLALHQRRALLNYLPTLVAAEALPGGGVADSVEYIRKEAVRRLTGQMVAQLHRLAVDAEPDELAEAMGQARDALITASGTPQRPDVGLSRDIEAHLNGDPGQDSPQVPAPYAELDELLDGGWTGSQLIVIAGRPGMGKSAMGLDVVRHAAKTGHRALLVSLEMSRAEISARYIAATARVSLSTVRRMRKNPDVVTHEENARLAGIATQLPQLDDLIRVIDPSTGGAYTVPALKRHLAAMRALGTPADIVVVDYLQLLTPAQHAQNREGEVAEMTRALKLLALELDIPVIAISQLNRNAEARHDKRPQVADLRESGAIENDADIVILLHREDYYDPESPRRGEIDLIVGKHRNGSTRTIAVAHQLHYMKLADMPR